MAEAGAKHSAPRCMPDTFGQFHLFELNRDINRSFSRWTWTEMLFQVRSDPAEHVRNAVDQVKAARMLTQEYKEVQTKRMTLRQDSTLWVTDPCENVGGVTFF